MFNRKLRIDGLEVDFDSEAMKKVAKFVEMDSATIASVHYNEFTTKKYSKRDTISRIYQGKEAGIIPVIINVFRDDSRYEISGWVITEEIVDDQPLIS